MTHQLIVTRPFLNFVRGDIIADSGKISEILSTEHRKFVTKVALPTTSKG
jgi:hypothetical protein